MLKNKNDSSGFLILGLLSISAILILLVFGVLKTDKFGKVGSLAQNQESEAARLRLLWPNAVPYDGSCINKAGIYYISGLIDKNSSRELKFPTCLSQTTLSMQLILDSTSSLGEITLQITKPDGSIYTGPTQGALFRPAVPDGQWKVLLTNLNSKKSINYYYYLYVTQL